MRPTNIGLAVILLLLTLSGLLLTAQEVPAARPLVPADVCAEPLALALLNASDACVGKPYGFVCNGGASPLVEPPGPIANSLAARGALVDTGIVTSIRTLGIDPTGLYAGIAWMRVAAPDSLVTFSALLIGDVRVENVTPPDFPAWQALEVETVEAQVACETAAHSTLVLQNPVPGQAARLVINGVSLDLNGTLAIQTDGDDTLFMALSGEVRMLFNGQRATASAGQMVIAPHAPDDFSRPAGALLGPNAYDPLRIEHLPLALFDRPVPISAGGSATTTGAVNLRTAPNTDAAVVRQVPAAERVTLLGRNPVGDWLHVRTSLGETGWMFSELLRGDTEQISKVYEQTPVPVQRLGTLGQEAHIIAPRGFDLRTAPDISFPTIGFLPAGAKVTLSARSPYSPWVKIEAGGVYGWIALLALETRAIIDALPIDYDVPPPPEPTRVPGSFGNAFPDPSCYPNC